MVPDETRIDSEPALAPAQLKARLWADARQQVYAVVMGARVPDLAARLEQADVLDHDCLLPGALEPDEEPLAPYLVQLARESAFTDWLLFEAQAGLGDWGLLVLTAAPRMALRAHLRGLLQARLPDGLVMDLAWMDPEILRALLPLFDPAGLAVFMGPVTSLVVPRAAEWTSGIYVAGSLGWRRTPVAAAA